MLALIEKIVDAVAVIVLRWIFSKQWARVQEMEREDGFDETYQTNTTGMDVWQNYIPTLVRTFRDILEVLPVSAQQCCFIDVGSGRGRVALLAVPHFQRVIGVEIAPELHADALRNAERFRHKTGIQQCPEFVCADIRDYLGAACPNTDVVLYMYAPFSHRRLREVLSIVLERHPRQRALYLLFVNPLPHFVKVIESFSAFVCLESHEVNHPFLAFFQSYRIYQRQPFMN
jgi:SAM-dependent methyltransferase